MAKIYFLVVKMSIMNRSDEDSLTASNPLALRQIAPIPYGMHGKAFYDGSISDPTDNKKASGRPISCRAEKQVGSLWIISLITVTAE